MKNITVAVDDDTYRLARIRAAELDTSVSALVRDYLRMLTTKPAEEALPAESASERRGRLLREVVANFDAQGRKLRGPDAPARQGLYERAAARVEADARRRSVRNRAPRT